MSTGQGPQPPPPIALLQMITGKWVSQAIYAAAELGVADHLVAGPRSSEDLARTLEVDPGALHRLLRALTGLGVFQADATGWFSLTPIGEALRSDAPDSMRGFARMMGMPATWRAWEDVLYSVRTGRSAFVHQHGGRAFEYFATHPEESAIFDDAMASFSASEVPPLLAAYDFSAFTRIVDVAGGSGQLLAAILGANPQASGVLFDLPHVTGRARAQLETAGLTGRCEVIAGDFFEAPLPPGSGAYLLKHILHDWDDARCVDVLRACRAAMDDSARLLVIEMVLPAGNEPFFGKLLDLEMLVITPGGRERTEAEYRALFAEADLALTRVVPTQAPISVLEASPGIGGDRPA